MAEQLQTSQEELHSFSTVLASAREQLGWIQDPDGEKAVEQLIKDTDDAMPKLDANIEKQKADLNEATEMLDQREARYQQRLADTEDTVFRTMQQNIEQRKPELEAELSTHDSKVRLEVTRFIHEAGAIVNDSNAIHACAGKAVPECIDLLMEFVPVEARR
jgi:chromosome segregation ATPase